MIKKILIVDDSLIARKLLILSLPRNKIYETHLAVNGREGVEMYRETRHDVVFMDLTMPVLDGYEAIKELIELDKNVFVVAATADVQPKSIQRVMDSGAFSVIKKPVTKEKVQNVLEKIDTQLKQRMNKDSEHNGN